MPGLGVDGAVFDAFMVLDAYAGRRRTNRVLGPVRRWNDERLARRLTPTPGRDPVRDAVPVPRRSSLSRAEFVSEFQRPGRPVILTGMAAKWAAVQRWDLRFFDRRFGAVDVLTVDGVERGCQDEEEGLAEIHLDVMPLHDQLDAVRKGGGAYLSFSGDLFERDPALLDDLDLGLLRSYIRPTRFVKRPPVKLFIGGAGTSTQWHTDPLQTMFVQVRGTKEWVFCPPTHTACVDGRVSMLDQQYAHSMVDFRDPDLERYPLYSAAPTSRAVLEPGDVLYVPPFWWHCVSNPEPSIGAAVWWYSVRKPIRAHPTMFWLLVLSPQHLLRAARLAVARRRKGDGQTGTNIYGKHVPVR